MSAEIMSEPDEKRADEKMAGGHSLSIQELLDLYAPVKEQIEARLEEFGHIWETASDEDLFRELVFCLLTPQSKARICWRAVERLLLTS